MKSISITLLLCFSFGLIQRANAQDNCETLTAKVNALYIQLNTQKNTQNNCVMQKNAATESWKAAKNKVSVLGALIFGGVFPRLRAKTLNNSRKVCCGPTTKNLSRTTPLATNSAMVQATSRASTTAFAPLV